MAAEGGDIVDVLKSHCPQHHIDGEVPTMDSMNSGNPTKCVVPDWCSTYPPEMQKSKPECQCPDDSHP